MMRGRLYYDAISIPNRRRVNMDSLLIKERTVCGKQVCLAVVCDGVGSLESGAFAASEAVQRLGIWLDGLDELSRAGLDLRNAVLRINREIIEFAEKQGLRTATTLSALLLVEGQYYIVHAGDSRIYTCTEDGIRQLTRDDVDSDGKLTQCIGRSRRVTLFYNEGTSEGSLFLLCSDGLYKRMEPEYFHQQLVWVRRNELHQTIENLVVHVVSRGETDNISIAIVKSRG